jgi:2-keto-3-deoxy-L-rhamnonate aldolase RhmA
LVSACKIFAAAAVPLLAKAAGYDWLFIDAEHGSISSFLDRSSDEPR